MCMQGHSQSLPPPKAPQGNPQSSSELLSTGGPALIPVPTPNTHTHSRGNICSLYRGEEGRAEMVERAELTKVWDPRGEARLFT